MAARNQWFKSWLMSVGLLLLAAVSGAGSADDAERLKRQVQYLSEALVTAKVEIDALRAQLDVRAYSASGGVELEAPGAAVREKEYRVVDVNKELGMVILDGGRQDGIRSGLQFAVIEMGQAVAKVRIVDVRTAVAGALVQESGLGYPKAGDRAVLATGSRK